MPIPKSVTKIKKDGVEFISSVDRCSYTIKELSRAALRDVGKFVCAEFRKSYYSYFKRKRNTKKGTKKTNTVWIATQYWVRKKEPRPDLQIGIKPNAFYGGYQEFGSSKTPKLGLLKKAVMDNIPTIIRIESQYLSALEDEAEALALIEKSSDEGEAV